MRVKDATNTHAVNGIVVEQRLTDGFINGTAMCVAHKKRLQHWFNNEATINLLEALATDLGIGSKGRNSGLCSIESIATTYPELIITRRGNPSDGGGTWLHPDLAVQLAQWCSPVFAIQVSRWVREWLIATQGNEDGEVSTGATNLIRQELKEIRGDIRMLTNLKRVALAEHPGLGELIEEYGRDEPSIPCGLPNPFTYTEWLDYSGFRNGSMSARQRIAASVKALRGTRKLNRRGNHVLYYHSDLPAFNALVGNSPNYRLSVVQ